ncbi:MAG: ribonuclease H-like domain-containing protein, partial [Clostridia bacterium]
MIRNLKAKLNALSTAPSVPQTPPQTICFMRETASPLMDFPGLTTLSEAHIRRLCDVEVAQDWDIRRTLFLDTETTGLRGAGTVAFLIGVGFVQDEGFVVRQLLMRDYPEEPALLEELAQLLPRFDRVVTFNGKSFDIPLLRDRFTMARLRARWRELPQLDLMHPSRRVWRLRLQNCRLSNLEGA